MFGRTLEHKASIRCVTIGKKTVISVGPPGNPVSGIPNDARPFRGVGLSARHNPGTIECRWSRLALANCYSRSAEESDDPHYSEVRDGQQERSWGKSGLVVNAKTGKDFLLIGPTAAGE